MEHSLMRKYAPPTLLRRDRLPNVVAGTPPVVTDRQLQPGKGGCFEAPQKRSTRP